MRGVARASASVALVGALVLGGCAATPPPGDAGAAPDATDPTAPAAVAALDARRAALDAFAVGGALGYWTEEQNLTARIDWREADGRTALRLIAPLGLGTLALDEGPGGATLSRSGATPVSGASAGTLLQAALGLDAPIPLGAARDWLRGLPGPGATDVRRDAAGRLETLLWTDAAGQRWFARVRRWTDVDGLELPALLTARSGERRMRLALSDWRLGPGTVPAGAPDRRPEDPPGAAPDAADRLSIPGR